MSDKEFIAIFIPFCEYYGNAGISKNVLAQYFEDLCEFSMSELKSALRHIRRTRKYSNMPSIAEIIQAIQGDENERIVMARETLKNAMSRYGSYRSVCFADKAIMSVVKSLGGWAAYGNMSGKDLDDFYKFEFAKLYKAFINHPDYAPKYLMGETEAQIRQMGREPKSENIVLIGFNGSGCEMNLLEFRGEKVEQIEHKKPNFALAFKRVGA